MFEFGVQIGEFAFFLFPLFLKPLQVGHAFVEGAPGEPVMAHHVGDEEFFGRGARVMLAEEFGVKEEVGFAVFSGEDAEGPSESVAK